MHFQGTFWLTFSAESSYTGSIKIGTTITYGQNRTIKVTGDQYNALLIHFRGKTVPVGTSRTNPPAGSVGEWLQLNVTGTAISSYVCPILIAEGYAEKIGRSQIRFREIDMLPFDEIWNRIVAHAGETFHTITGLEFTYDVREDKFYPSRTNYGIAKSDFKTAYQYVPIERPSLINRVVRGPSYIWAVLHEQRISEGRW